MFRDFSLNEDECQTPVLLGLFIAYFTEKEKCFHFSGGKVPFAFLIQVRKIVEKVKCELGEEAERDVHSSWIWLSWKCALSIALLRSGLWVYKTQSTHVAAQYEVALFQEL